MAIKPLVFAVFEIWILLIGIYLGFVIWSLLFEMGCLRFTVPCLRGSWGYGLNPLAHLGRGPG